MPLGPRGWRWGRVALIVCFGAIQIVLAISDTPTTDEPRHLRDGAVALDRGQLDVNPEHPPLVKLLSAMMIPPSTRKAGLLASQAEDPLVADARFAVRVNLTGMQLLLVRLPVIIFAVAGLVAFGALFVRRSQWSGFAAVAILAGTPPFVAHSHYVTTDMAPLSLGLLSVWAGVALPVPSAAILGGLLFGLAAASKFSAPLILPFVAAFFLLRGGWKSLALFLAMSGLSLYAVESYASRGMTPAALEAMAERAFVTGGLGGPAPPSPSLHALALRVAHADVAVGSYWLGFSSVAHRSATAAAADMWMGRIVTGAQPLYPLVTLLVKNDSPLILLFFVALVDSARRKVSLGRYGWLMLGAAGFYLALAARSSLHLGVRHLLPLVALMAASATLALVESSRPVALLSRALLVAHVLAACSIFPHYTSARNLPSRVLVPTDVAYDLSEDWGQDLGRFLRRERAPVSYVSFLTYRVPDWAGLFPLLRYDASSLDRVIADRVAINVLAASTKPGIPESAKPILAAVEPHLAVLRTLRTDDYLVSAPEPTLMLFSKRPDVDNPSAQRR